MCGETPLHPAHVAPALFYPSSSFNASSLFSLSVGCSSLSDVNNDHFFIFLNTKKKKNENDIYLLILDFR